MPQTTDLITDQLTKFGLSEFRPGQRDVVDAIIDGKDCLCIMPTGGGKSLCYQLPSLARAGTTLVVSPLIALMKDQVDALQRLKINATFINSSLDTSTQRQRIENFANGQYDLVYIAPERLRNLAFLEAAKQCNIQLLAIDEAHCISEWGHDFRPDYARIGRFRKRIGKPQTIALTATATVTVRQDILSVLNLENPSIFVSGFARKNLSLCVESPTSNSSKDQRLLEYLKQTAGAGIIYATTRKGCEHLVELLSSQLERSIAFYHAGMDAAKRRQIQDEFMSGKIPIVVATNAFGMGIDRSDLRFVVHYNMPGSLEAYYQEAGRAGRDGLSSQCLLLYSYQDRFIQEFFIENAYPSREIVKQVYEYLRSIQHDPIELTLQEIKDDLGVSIGSEGIAVSENLLEKAGILERLDSQQNMASIKIDSELPTLVDLLPKESKVQRKVLRSLETIVGPMRGERVYFHSSRLSAMTDMKWEAVVRSLRELCKLPTVDYVPPFRGRAVHMIRRDLEFSQIKIDFDELDRRKAAEYDRLERVVEFVHSRQCRQRVILDYFGDPDSHDCQRCDHCDPSQSQFGNGSPGNLTDASAGKSSSNTHDEKDNGALYAVQVALSGAARTNGRVGKQLLVQMLQGSSAKKVKQLGLSLLPTFGKLKRVKQSDVAGLIDSLLQSRMLEQSEKQRFRPIVSITEYGREIMAGKTVVGLRRTLGDQRADYFNYHFRDCCPIGQNAVDSVTNDFEQQGESASQENQHESLIEPLSEAPEYDEYWSQEVDPEFFVDQMVEPQKDPPSQESQATPASSIPAPHHDFNSAENGVPAKPSNTSEKPSYYWTWQLFDSGYTFDQVKQIRRLDESTINAHLQQASNNQLAISEKWHSP